ncbi:TRAP transporter substrate-binding protein [Bordetella trematum]|uniref:TRAP transporter substrate-binding protein n=1 Tax=Bordetella trematum TaxID=123899 RepID=UPI001558C60D|nr:TRAP transporter substrate-binding protein [Bordetella trematum]
MRTIAKWIATLSLALPAAAAHAQTTWTMASGYPENSFFTQNIRQFISEVEKESGGRLKIDLRPNDTLIKHDAIKRAVQTGQIQAGEVRLGVHGNEDPVYALDGLPNIAGNYDEAWMLMQAQQPYLEKILGRHNMRAIAFVAWPGQGLYTKTPLASPEDFKGKRLRIYSQPTLKMGQMLGFQATILPFAEVPQAFATGLIDSLFTSAQTGIDTQAWDNVKYFMYTGTLHNKNMLVVNERALKRLDDDLQKIVLEAGERASKRGFEMSRKASDDTIATLRQHGMEVSEAPESILKKFSEVGQAMIEDWRKTANPEQQKVLDTYLEMKQKAGG